MPPTPTETAAGALADALSAVTVRLDGDRRRTPDAALLALLAVLESVAGHDGIRPSVLADRLGIDRSLVARRVRDAVDAGFVDVVDHPRDRRSSLVRLTPAGADELARLVDAHRHRLGRFVDAWEPGDVRTLTGLLEKLQVSMNAVARQERRRRARRPPRGAGQPDWLIAWLDH